MNFFFEFNIDFDHFRISITFKFVHFQCSCRFVTPLIFSLKNRWLMCFDTSLAIYIFFQAWLKSFKNRSTQFLYTYVLYTVIIWQFFNILAKYKASVLSILRPYDSLSCLKTIVFDVAMIYHCAQIWYQTSNCTFQNSDLLNINFKETLWL